VKDPARLLTLTKRSLPARANRERTDRPKKKEKRNRLSAQSAKEAQVPVPPVKGRRSYSITTNGKSTEKQKGKRRGFSHTRKIKAVPRFIPESRRPTPKNHHHYRVRPGKVKKRGNGTSNA